MRWLHTACLTSRRLTYKWPTLLLQGSAFRKFLPRRMYEHSINRDDRSELEETASSKSSFGDLFDNSVAVEVSASLCRCVVASLRRCVVVVLALSDYFRITSKLSRGLVFACVSFLLRFFYHFILEHRLSSNAFKWCVIAQLQELDVCCEELTPIDELFPGGVGGVTQCSQNRKREFTVKRERWDGASSFAISWKP